MISYFVDQELKKRKAAKKGSEMAEEFHAWRTKLLLMKRLKGAVQRSKWREETEFKARAHWEKALEGKILLAWCRAVGVSKTAAARARTMSEMAATREERAILFAWRRWAKREGRASRAAKAVKEGVRARLLRSGLNRWKALEGMQRTLDKAC